MCMYIVCVCVCMYIMCACVCVCVKAKSFASSQNITHQDSWSDKCQARIFHPSVGKRWRKNENIVHSPFIRTS